jgi:hypothetical protein
VNIDKLTFNNKAYFTNYPAEVFKFIKHHKTQRKKATVHIVFQDMVYLINVINALNQDKPSEFSQRERERGYYNVN